MYAIYKATNIINGKSYIGWTGRSVEVRFKQHCYDAFKRGSNVAFHRALRKYGSEGFTVNVLYQVDSVALVKYMERLCVVAYKAFGKNGYNRTLGGDGALGVNISENHRRIISESNRSRPISKETRCAISEKAKSRPVKRETIERLRSLAAANRGKSQSEDRRRKVSDALKGHSVSKETANKIRAKAIGRRHKPEIVRRVTEKITGENSRLAKSFIVTFPDGRETLIKGIALFCRQNGLHASAVRRCLAGKLNTHHGFSFREQGAK